MKLREIAKRIKTPQVLEKIPEMLCKLLNLQLITTRWPRL